MSDFRVVGFFSALQGTGSRRMSGSCNVVLVASKIVSNATVPTKKKFEKFPCFRIGIFFETFFVCVGHSKHL